jgi:hypothetical protein
MHATKNRFIARVVIARDDVCGARLSGVAF